MYWCWALWWGGRGVGFLIWRRSCLSSCCRSWSCFWVLLWLRSRFLLCRRRLWRGSFANLIRWFAQFEELGLGLFMNEIEFCPTLIGLDQGSSIRSLNNIVCLLTCWFHLADKPRRMLYKFKPRLIFRQDKSPMALKWMIFHKYGIEVSENIVIIIKWGSYENYEIFIVFIPI